MSTPKPWASMKARSEGSSSTDSSTKSSSTPAPTPTTSGSSGVNNGGSSGSEHYPGKYYSEARGWIHDAVEQGKAASSVLLSRHSEGAEFALYREVSKRVCLVTMMGPAVYSSLWLVQDCVKDIALLILPSVQTVDSLVKDSEEEADSSRARSSSSSSSRSNSSSTSNHSVETLYETFLSALVQPHQDALEAVLGLSRCGNTVGAHVPTVVLSLLLALQAPARAALYLNDKENFSKALQLCNPLPAGLLALGLWCSYQGAALDIQWQRQRQRQGQGQRQEQEQEQKQKRDDNHRSPRGLQHIAAASFSRPHRNIALCSCSALALWGYGASWFVDTLVGSEVNRGLVQSMLAEKAAATAVTVSAGNANVQTLWEYGPTASLGLGIVAYITCGSSRWGGVGGRRRRRPGAGTGAGAGTGERGAGAITGAGGESCESDDNDEC